MGFSGQKISLLMYRLGQGSAEIVSSFFADPDQGVIAALMRNEFEWLGGDEFI